MNHYKVLSLVFIAGFVISGCKSDLPVAPSDVNDNKAMITLKVGEKFSHQGATIEFMEVSNDSRCPKGLECVWQGNGQAVFLVSDKASVQTLTLNTTGGREYPKQRNIYGYSLELMSLKPYPANNIKIDASQYQATLHIKPQDESTRAPVIIDVRSTEEFSEGHYQGAINLVHSDISQTIGALNLQKNQEIILYCRSGNRAGKAKEALEELGYTNVVNGINQENLHKLLKTESEM